MLSIIIPHRNEDMLGFTIERIRATCSVPHEIITVDDGSDHQAPYPMPDECISLKYPVGNCYSRDRGIMAASNDACLVLDAHMNFHDGDDWAGKLLAWRNSGPTNRIACTVCPTLSRDDMEMRPGRGNYHGAYIKTTDFSGGRHRALPNKWGPYEAPCQVGCVLGGAYLLSREWYASLGRPWSYMRGWGHSEQIISVVNWLMGGENWLVDVEIGHMFRTGRYNEVPYRTMAINPYANMYTVVNVCVHDEEEAQAYRDWMAPDIAALEEGEPGFAAKLFQLLDDLAVPEYAAEIRADAVRTWAEYKATWMDPYDEETTA
jgi:glycosyltransferase involved in cell wall biosynthesis